MAEIKLVPKPLNPGPAAWSREDPLSTSSSNTRQDLVLSCPMMTQPGFPRMTPSPLQQLPPSRWSTSKGADVLSHAQATDPRGVGRAFQRQMLRCSYKSKRLVWGWVGVGDRRGSQVGQVGQRNLQTDAKSWAGQALSARWAEVAALPVTACQRPGGPCCCRQPEAIRSLPLNLTAWGEP